MSKKTLRVSNHSIGVTNTEKVFFPADGITKGDLVGYYYQVASTMLRHVRGRPVSMLRFPDGIRDGGFFHKEVPGHFPEWIRRATIPKKEGGKVTHAVCDDAAALVYLADQACITPHVWLSRADQPDLPDRLIFDLDPTTTDLGPVRDAARGFRELLGELGLVPFVMTTGSRGFHVLVPLRRGAGFDDTREFAQDAARLLASRAPDTLTVDLPKERRGDRVFLDYLRNSYAQTSVAPYAVRAKPAAPVATPLAWDELATTGPQDFTMHNLLQRLESDGDPWSNVTNRARSLDGPRRRLNQLLNR